MSSRIPRIQTFVRCAPVILVALTAPVVTCAQDITWLVEVLVLVKAAVGMLVPILLSLAVVVFVWGALVFIRNAGDEKARSEGRTKMIWGIIALFVIVSVWGLVALLQEIGGIDETMGTQAPFSNFN